MDEGLLYRSSECRCEWFLLEVAVARRKIVQAGPRARDVLVREVNRTGNLDASDSVLVVTLPVWWQMSNLYEEDAIPLALDYIGEG